MNRYPAWKYALIALTLVAGFIYTLPNFYGEAPAVQVSPVRATLKVGAAMRARVEAVLQQHGISPHGVSVDQSGIKVRVGDPDVQLRAKDALQAALGEDYVVALNLVPRSPEWLGALGARPMHLGLDLQGGVHFLLQVDMKAALDKRMEGYLNDTRLMLREQRISYSGATREGQTISIRFVDDATRHRALEVIGRGMPDLALTTRDQGGELLLVATLKPEASAATQKATLEQNITTLRNRVNELGVAEPIVQQQGGDRVVVQLPGVQDTAKAKDILGRTATLEFRMVEAHASDPRGRGYDPARIQTAASGGVPFGAELIYDRSSERAEPLLLSKHVVITGDRLTHAAPSVDQQTQRPVVSVRLDAQGARVMRELTQHSIGQRMAVLLIEKGKPEVLTAPVIQGEFGGEFQITGRFTSQEATDLALLLRAGALAAPMEIVEERTVGPSLGAENIRIGFQSTWIGFAAVAVFMVAYYGLFGVFSALALAANVLFLVALLSMLQATLTLPGMAGIALTLGMAIDANVLINERIREEMRGGRTPHAAIAAGYERAWGTILDSNLTTLIAGLALFALGSGPVRGFAVVLCLGILTSVFSAVVLSRALVGLAYGHRRRLTRISLGYLWNDGDKAKAASG